jgi:hypothetical protein
LALDFFFKNFYAFGMPRKTTVLILILAVVTAVLVYLAVGQQKEKSQSTPSLPRQTSPTTRVEKTAVLSFSPESVLINKGGKTVVSVVLSSANPVSGVQIELLFDPKAISKIEFSTPSANPVFRQEESIVLFEDVDYQSGRLSYAVAVKPGVAQPVAKNQPVVDLVLTSNPVFDKESTQIMLLEKSMVTTIGTRESILGQMRPLTINFSQTNGTSSLPTQDSTNSAQY